MVLLQNLLIYFNTKFQNPQHVGNRYQQFHGSDGYQPEPSTSMLTGVQSLRENSPRLSSQEKIQLQPLHVRQDSPSLVKVKSWYTMSKRDVC